MIESKHELVTFLKERSMLKVLEIPVLQEICNLFQETACGPGHIVFKQGDVADAFYIIREGSVEVIQGDTPPKVVAYLTSGDCFGEMALMHGTTRNATIRVPEEALLLRLSRKAFSELQSYFPEVTREITRLINRRLSGKLPANMPGLQGNLAFFDLPTVIQTVVASRQTGVLNLRGRAAKLIAQVHLNQGKLTQVNFLHLTGEAAFFELLTRNEPLDFVFEPQKDSDSGHPQDKALMSQEPYKLLMEGARRADELPKLMNDLDWPDNLFTPVGPPPDWSTLPSDVQTLGRKIWLLLEVGLAVQQLTEKLPYDRYTILSALNELRKRRCIRSSTRPFTTEREISYPRSDIALLVSAFNAISSNLATILGTNQVRQVLNSALEESTTRYTNLSSLKINPQTTTLDVRLAKPDVSQSEASAKSLEHLTLTFLRLIAASHD